MTKINKLTILKSFSIIIATVVFGVVLLREASPVRASQLIGDVNGDGVVNISDLAIMAANWGVTSGATWAMGNLNSDGAVNISDLAILTAHWGNTLSELPSVPSGLSANGTSSSTVSLSWSADSGTGITYLVYRNGTEITTTGSTSYGDAGLAADTSYSYTVAASNSFGTSDQSDAQDATTSSASGFYPDSFWDLPEAETEANDSSDIASNSSTLVANLNTQWHTYYGTFGLNSGTAGIPIFTVPSDEPDATVSVSGGCGDFTTNTGTQIPIPYNAYPTPGSDHIIDIYQPSSQTEWELWKATNNSVGTTSTWSACWGGKITNMNTTADAVFPNPYGESATGLPYLAGTITENDVQSGAIDHAVVITISDTAASPCYVSPADRCDGSSNNSDAVPEGTWFAFPSSVTMPNGLPALAQMVFTAVQKYGMFVIDTSGGTEMSTENSNDWAYNGNSGTDPITAAMSPDNQSSAYAVLGGLPWSDLVVINPPSL